MTKKEIIELAWKTFELKDICEKLGLHPDKNGELKK